MIKMRWKHYQTVHPIPPLHPPQKKEARAGGGLFGDHLLILHFKFRLSKSIKSSTVHIYPVRKNLSFPKGRKNHPKLTQNRQTVINEISREI